MSLSRRHFNAIAKAAKANRLKPGGTAEAFLHELADILATASGTFQKEKFLAACGCADQHNPKEPHHAPSA